MLLMENKVVTLAFHFRKDMIVKHMNFKYQHSAVTSEKPGLVFIKRLLQLGAYLVLMYSVSRNSMQNWVLDVVGDTSSAHTYAMSFLWKYEKCRLPIISLTMRAWLNILTA